MPYLYCESDGQDLADVLSKSEELESTDNTKIVWGPLNRDGLRCDKCNRPLDKSDIGYLFISQTGKKTDNQTERDFFDEGATNATKIYG